MTRAVCRHKRRILCALLLLILGTVAISAAAGAEREPPPAQRIEELAEIPAVESAPVVFEPGAPAETTTLHLLIPLAFLLLAILLWYRGRLAEGRTRVRWYQLGAAFLFLAVLSGGVILAQQRDGDGDAATTRTRSRRGICELEGAFGLRVVFDRNTSRDLLFVELEPGLQIDSPSGRLVMKEKDVRVVTGSFPGRIKFKFRRGVAGTEFFFEREQAVASNADIRALVEDIGRNPPEMGAPTGLNAKNTPISERLQGEVDYDPDDPNADDCAPIRSPWLTITWRSQPSPAKARWIPMEPLADDIDVPTWRSRVRVSKDIVDETTGFPGEVNKATHTQVVFSVDEPYRCCGRADVCHSIIQFVRHTWEFSKGKPMRDRWNLDGPESQAERRAQGLDYDPTYTTDPHHGAATANEDNGLVHVGPWDGAGGNAISVDDYPGLLTPDHERFVKRGGMFQWEFITLLVCREATGSARQYLKNGKVRARTGFTVQRIYPAPGSKEPISVRRDFPTGANDPRVKHYEPCKDLSEVLKELGLTDAFNNPRPHRVLLK
jgi:hypothetical protein